MMPQRSFGIWRRPVRMTKHIDGACVRRASGNLMIHGLLGNELMGDDITFEDGRVCWLGTSPLVWVLEDVIEYVSPEFALWLRDVSSRPRGLASFDVRGLPAIYRKQFYSGLQRAFTVQMADPQMREKLGHSRYLGAFLTLLTTYKHSRRRERLEKNDQFFANQPVDSISINDLWYCPSCGENLDEHPVSSCANCGWKYPY
jgi:hypothetical protein